MTNLPKYPFYCGEYRIVPGSYSHISQIPAVETAAAVRFPQNVLPAHAIHDTVSLTTLTKATKENGLWVSLLKDQVTGFALLKRLDGLHLLEELDVLPEHGCRGLGRTLVQCVATQAKAEGGEFLYLTTFASIPWNAPFYTRLGFTPMPQQQMPPALADILSSEQKYGLRDRIVMQLPLTDESVF